MELMMRIAEFDASAKACGDVGEFYTVSPDEEGANKHRFKYESIDPSK